MIPPHTHTVHKRVDRDGYTVYRDYTRSRITHGLDVGGDEIRAFGMFRKRADREMTHGLEILLIEFARVKFDTHFHETTAGAPTFAEGWEG